MTNCALRPSRGLFRLWRCCDGVSAVELAFILPVLLLFLLGICEFGRALWTQNTLQQATEIAARCAVLNAANCTPDVPTYAANQMVGISVSSSDFTYVSGQSCGVSGNTKGALVTASHVFDPMVPNLVPGLAITLTAKSCYP